jgi:hypothetical protein
MNRDDVVAEVADVVVEALPDLRQHDVRRVIDEVAPGKTVLKLQRYLESHSGFLLSGDGRIPVQVFRLLVRLESMENLEVVVPQCADCGKRRNLTRVRDDGCRICQGCCLRRAADVCSACGRTRPIMTRRKGVSLCGTCYAKDPSRFDECADCGRLSRVAARRPDGGSTCDVAMNVRGVRVFAVAS